MSTAYRNGTTLIAETASLPTKPVSSAHAGTVLPDPQVCEKPTRRRFSTAYKLRILKEADACTKPGEIGALLRREGLYSSALSAFRKQLAEGRLVVRSSEQVQTQRKQRAAERQQQARRLAHLEQENHKLRTLLEVQKKLADLLGIDLSASSSD